MFTNENLSLVNEDYSVKVRNRNIAYADPPFDLLKTVNFKVEKESF